MEEKKSKLKMLSKAMDIFFEVFIFVALEYIIYCCAFSLREFWLRVIFRALSIAVIGKYLIALKQLVSNKVLITVIFLLSIAAVIASACLGYLEVSFVSWR